MRGRVTAWDVFSWAVAERASTLKNTVRRKCTCQNRRLNSCQKDSTQAENKIDMKTSETDCTHEFTRLTQWLLHNLFCDHFEITATNSKTVSSENERNVTGLQKIEKNITSAKRTDFHVSSGMTLTGSWLVSHSQRDMHTRLCQRGQDWRQWRRSFPAITSLSHDCPRRSCCLWTVSRRQEERQIHNIQKKKKHSIAVELWCCCLCFDKPAKVPHPCCRTATKTFLMDCGDDLTSNNCSRVGRLLFWRSSEPVASDGRRRFRTAVASNLPVCSGKTNNAHHGTIEQKTTNARKHHFPSSEDVADTSNQPHSWVGQPTLVCGRCDCLSKFARLTKRATPSTALLAFLPLQAAATLRERPVPLRRSRLSCSPCRWQVMEHGTEREHNSTSKGVAGPRRSCLSLATRLGRVTLGDVLTNDTKLVVRSSSTDHGAKTMGSCTRTTNFRVASLPTLQSANCKPFPTNGRAAREHSPGLLWD